ncbi:WYL domain-containing protein [uncultured Ferrimonas sp.]|uniref:WYL domain-containing protein n=1 Tax=uncultured Ferrimonas sp. TaxID=432640 RepID=UPI002632899F|nr:WYL domain-containing protein [uncultured Ferrimonas sp.]
MSATSSSIEHVTIDKRLRFRLIELIALWEGRLTTNHLCQAFGIGRQQASKDINLYLNEFAEGQLIYDKSLKGYAPTAQMQPKFCQGLANEYLQLLDKHDELGGMLAMTNLSDRSTAIVDPPSRYVEPHIIRMLVRAAREGLTLEGHYDSLSSPQPEDDPTRLLAPHTLVFNGFRWHVRAWCEKNQDFRDFVVTRFRDQLTLEDKPAAKTKADDADWHQQLEVTIGPNPRLSPRQQQVIAKDNGMDLDSLRRSEVVSKALLNYWFVRWQVAEPYNQSQDAQFQQVVLIAFKPLAT